MDKTEDTDIFKLDCELNTIIYIIIKYYGAQWADFNIQIKM